MRIPSPRANRKARIEIIPLIDVVFFLLATFVMTSLSMVQNQGVSVNLPSAATSLPENRRSSVTITVTESDDLFLDKDRVAADELKERLRALKSSEPDLKVFINGDERAMVGLMVRVLDEVRSIGITKVAIQTKAER